MSLRRALVPLSAVCAMSAAHAQSSPYYIGVSQTFTRESNVNRVPDYIEQLSDTISTTTLLGGVDQYIGRQRLYGNVNYSDNRFEKSKALNNNSYGLALALDWSTVERVSGTLSVRSNRSLSRYDYSNFNEAGKQNMRTNSQFGSTVRVGVVTRLTAEASYFYNKVDYSAEDSRARNFSQNSVSGGLRYRFSGELDAGAALRLTKGSYPNVPVRPVAGQPNAGATTKDDIDRRDIDLTSNWTPNAISRVSARVSLSDTKHSYASASDFSGVTGSLAWDWRPTGKLRFVTTLLRDTGEDAGYLNLGVIDQQMTTSRISTSLQVQATYELSAKVVVDGAARYVYRDIEIDRGPLLASSAGSDRLSYFSLGVRWSPTRVFSLGCTATYEKRTGDLAVSYPYDANTFGCFGQAQLQF